MNFKKLGNKVSENELVKNIIHFLTDTSTFKKTIILAIFYVFLFYLPFTFITLFLNKVVFFQLDYVFQFSTIVLDFRNRLMNLNFSTWDFKNSIGYDYFANFYYIPLDFSLLPFFLFPFLASSKLMWLSFLLKVIAGTAAFTYLLKLYRFKNKNILLVAILYGTADLFFAQNVFPSYSGLTFYIPLILIAIELIFQKKNFLFFSFSIFQIFLFNSYWSWALSLFMAIALLIRYLHEHFTFKNFYHPITYANMMLFLFKCILFFLLGLGLAAFFVLPVINIMLNEPRMLNTTNGDWLSILTNKDNLISSLQFNNVVYFKMLFKMLVPNLYMYSGFFFDDESVYWLTTNHIIIFSSILASFTLFYFIVYPSFIVKKKLTEKQYKTFTTLKIVTLLATFFMIFPLTAYIFSMTPSPYLRWLVFYGVLLIINFAFIIEYKLFNKNLFTFYLLLAIGYLIFSLYYNRNYGISKNNIFLNTDDDVAFTMIIVYIIITLLVVLFGKYAKLSLILIIERFAQIGLIFAICVSPYFTSGVRHADVYGKEINKLMKDVELPTYYTSFEFLFYDDESSIENMADMAYLADFDMYNNFDVFHSLINPYFTFHNNKNSHKRYYRGLDVPFLYYYYMDPTLFIMSNSKTVKNSMYNPNFTEEFIVNIDEFNSNLTIYQSDPQFSIGNGYTSFYSLKSIYSNFDYQWMDSLYISNTDIIDTLLENNFRESIVSKSNFTKRFSYLTRDITDIKPQDEENSVSEENLEIYELVKSFGHFKKIDVNLSKDDTDVLLAPNSGLDILLSVDENNNVSRCFNKFCYMTDNGIKSILVLNPSDGSKPEFPNLYGLKLSDIQDKTDKMIKYSTYDVKIDGNKIDSKINNDKPLIMTYKVGYAKGWSVFVDDKLVETFPSYNGQLSFILDKTGEQSINLRYKTPWFNEGLIISGISLVVFISIYKFNKYNNRGKK